MDKEQLIIDLFNKSLTILINHPNDERILVPLMKTLDHILDTEIIHTQSELLKPQLQQIFDLILKETKTSKMILKVSIILFKI